MWKKEDNILCTAIDRPSQSSRLTRQVESQIQIKEVLECLSCNSSDSTLANISKDCVQQFTEESRPDPCRTVYARRTTFSQIQRRHSTNVHPTIKLPATIHTVELAVISTFRESMIPLNMIGTWTFKI